MVDDELGQAGVARIAHRGDSPAVQVKADGASERAATIARGRRKDGEAQGRDPRHRVRPHGAGGGVRAACGLRARGHRGSQLEKTRQIAADLGIARASDDWRALLADVKPDLVSVATPAYLHHPMMLAALDQGAHVLCEKPTALHRHQAAEMRDRAAARSRVAAINHEFRLLPARRFALERVRGCDRHAAARRDPGALRALDQPQSRAMTWLADRTKAAASSAHSARTTRTACARSSASRIACSQPCGSTSRSAACRARRARGARPRTTPAPFSTSSRTARTPSSISMPRRRTAGSGSRSTGAKARCAGTKAGTGCGSSHPGASPRSSRSPSPCASRAARASRRSSHRSR